MNNTNFLYDEEKQTPEGMVSVSQLQTFLSCKRKWKYNYIDNIKPRVERSYLTIGKLCHKGMQVAMQRLWEFPSSDFDYLLDEAVRVMEEEYNNYCLSIDFLPEEAPDIAQLWVDAKSVFTQALTEFDPMKYEVITVMKDGKPIPALELHFVVPCPPTEGLHGYIDAILKDKETGFTWCTDYKFRKSLSPDEDEAFNIQNAVYCYACHMMDIDITGTMTWQHINTPAADPQLLKTGAVSRAKIRTTWDHYALFCQEHGEDPEDYVEEMQEKLADIEWYRPTLEYRNEETIKRIWETCVLPVASDVKSAYTNENNYPSLYPWNCKMCQYQSLCQAQLRDYDVPAIMQREYVKREYISDVSPVPSLELENA